MGIWHQWRGHSIGHNKACQRPSRFLFVDTETRPRQRDGERTYTENELRLGVACYVEWRHGRQPKETWWTFTESAGFWLCLPKLLSSRRTLWVVAHNAIFDYTVLGLWHRLECSELKTYKMGYRYRDRKTGAERVSKDWHGLLAIDGHPFHLELVHEKGRVNFSDLMNYYPCSLAEVAKSIGLEKLPMPDYAMGDPLWLEYCRNDVQILKTAYLNLIDQWQQENNGNWKMSAASLAWSNFRHKRDCSDIIIHNHAEARDLEFQSYYGGECRAWYRGKCPGPVVHLDVNSLYPAMMANHQYPVELIDYHVNPNPGIVESLAKRYAVCAEVTMENLCDDIPFRHNGRIVYPIGTFRTCIAGPEFTETLRGGCICRIHRVSYYKQRDIFTEYVQRWYSRKSTHRLAQEIAAEQFCKLMLNGLQGKFAQRSKAWKPHKNCEALQPWGFWPWTDPESQCVYPARSIGWNAQVAKDRQFCSHTFFAISAYITSYARCYMRNLRKDIPPSSLYYQDTDSLFIDADQLDNYNYLHDMCGDRLGQLRVVGRYKELIIRGRKNYTADGKHCIAGVRKKDIEISDMLWQGERMERANSLVGREPDDCIRSWKHEFATPGADSEGGYKPDGWYIPVCFSLTSKPIRIP